VVRGGVLHLHGGCSKRGGILLSAGTRQHSLQMHESGWGAWVGYGRGIPHPSANDQGGPSLCRTREDIGSDKSQVAACVESFFRRICKGGMAVSWWSGLRGVLQKALAMI
jgi:hypothetical protein